MTATPTAQPAGKIFGLGLSRTGTTSLHAALVLMGFSSVHYPLCYRELARHWLDGDFSPSHTMPFHAYGDLPTPCFFRELDASHPGSKFVLTVRDPDSWVESVMHQQAQPLPPSLKNPLRRRIRALCYGSGSIDRGRYLDVYRQHDDAVRAHFAARPEDLLVLDLAHEADAWQRLAGFLVAPAPSRAFPHLRTPKLGTLSWVTQAELPAKAARMGKLVAAA